MFQQSRGTSREKDRDSNHGSDRGGKERRERRDSPRTDGYTAMRGGELVRDPEEKGHDRSDHRSRSYDVERRRERDREKSEHRSRENRSEPSGSMHSRRPRDPYTDGSYAYSYEEMQPVFPALQDTGIVGPDPGQGSTVRRRHLEERLASEVPKATRSTRKNLRSTGTAEYAGFDYANWLECADAGELDVYTCLGLSNASTFSADTRKLLFRIISALFMQMGVPTMLLLIEVHTLEEQGEELSLRPINSETKFRMIGSMMIWYSLYSMYENCLDECRSTMLTFVLEQRFSWGYFWPMILGEFANIAVGVILLAAMFTSFANTTEGTELVLNAVAFNFLAGVDAEFVDRGSYVDAVDNFKEITAPFKTSLAKDSSKCWSRIVGGIMGLARICFLSLGFTLGLCFGILPERHDGSNAWNLPWKCDFTAWWLE